MASQSHIKHRKQIGQNNEMSDDILDQTVDNMMPTVIELARLTTRIRTRMEEFDGNNDGVLTLSDVIAIMESQRKWRRRFFAVAGLSVVFLGAVFGLFIAGYELTKRPAYLSHVETTSLSEAAALRRAELQENFRRLQTVSSIKRGSEVGALQGSVECAMAEAVGRAITNDERAFAIETRDQAGSKTIVSAHVLECLQVDAKDKPHICAFEVSTDVKVQANCPMNYDDAATRGSTCGCNVYFLDDEGTNAAVLAKIARENEKSTTGSRSARTLTAEEAYAAAERKLNKLARKMQDSTGSSGSTSSAEPTAEQIAAYLATWPRDEKGNYLSSGGSIVDPHAHVDCAVL